MLHIKFSRAAFQTPVSENDTSLFFKVTNALKCNFDHTRDTRSRFGSNPTREDMVALCLYEKKVALYCNRKTSLVSVCYSGPIRLILVALRVTHETNS